MKTKALLNFVLWYFSLSFLFSVMDFIRGLTEPSLSVEAVLIVSFAITWALDRDKELDK